MGERRSRVGGRHRWARRVFGVGMALGAVVAGSNLWLRMLSAGHLFEAPAVPTAPVVIVPGARVDRDGAPMTYLRGRLDVAIELLSAGKVRQILISGDAAGHSGDEIAAMRTYLLDRGVDPAVIRSDAEGLSTLATCERAQGLFGIDRAVIVTQRQHLPRAVALCRGVGIDADGVVASCDCRRITLVRNTIREWLAGPKAIAGPAAGIRRRRYR